MTKSERERLIEEKNQIIGSQINKPVKRSLFSNSNTNKKDEEQINESNLTETDRALLKVLRNLIEYHFNYNFRKNS